jgi:hypothetical protein
MKNDDPSCEELACEMLNLDVFGQVIEIKGEKTIMCCISLKNIGKIDF